MNYRKSLPYPAQLQDRGLSFGPQLRVTESVLSEQANFTVIHTDHTKTTIAGNVLNKLRNQLLTATNDFPITSV